MRVRDLNLFICAVHRSIDSITRPHPRSPFTAEPWSLQAPLTCSAASSLVSPKFPHVPLGVSGWKMEFGLGRAKVLETNWCN